MQSPRRLAVALGLLAVAGSVAAVGVGPLFVGAADHLDSPLVKNDARVDITDLYAFRTGANMTTLILNVNPLTSVPNSKAASFRQAALYEVSIDTNGDGRADITYRVKFSGRKTLSDGSVVQTYTVKRATGAAARRHEWTGTTVAIGKTSAYHHGVQIAPILGGGSAFAGIRDDPFFFDLVGFKHLKARLLAGSTTLGSPGDDPCTADNGTLHLLACFTATDTFAGTNVTSIALKIPNAKLGGTGHTVGIFSTTSILTDAGYQQFDRMGRPAINTVFNITDSEKDLQNVISPSQDRSTMKDTTTAVLNAFGTVTGVTPYTAGQVNAIANILLPDELTIKLGLNKPFAYFVGSPSLANLRLNGRRLSDDVIDAEFALVTNFALLSGDGVGANDSAFGSAFPYLAAPH